MNVTCAYCGSDRVFGKDCPACLFIPGPAEIVVARRNDPPPRAERHPLADETPVPPSTVDGIFRLRNGTIAALISSGKVATVPWPGGHRVPVSEIRRLQREGIPERTRRRVGRPRGRAGDDADPQAIVARIRRY